LLSYIILAATALAAGIQNSLAGGGTLYTFPALEYYVGPVHANATSTVALVTGSIASAWGFRSELQHSRKWLWWLVPPCIIGGILGTWLVMVFPEAVFKTLVPWLILAAATLFLLRPVISRWVGAGQLHEEPPLRVKIGVVFFQFIVAIYGGYFGAGIGILMLSALALMGLTDIHVMNGVKNVLATSINAVAAAVFVITGKVEWSLCWPMLISAIVGGFLGSRIAQRTSRTIVRRVVVAIGFTLAAYYFFQQLRG
jgi:uncharacterized membrane protein YfcA